MDGLIQSIQTMLENNYWLAPVLALAAGLLTSVTPCSLSGMSLMIGYIESGKVYDTKGGLKLAVAFALGSAAVFMCLGAIAAAIGSLFGEEQHWLHFVFGALMILMSLQLFGVLHIIPEFSVEGRKRSGTLAGAFIIGVIGGLFASHCATPVLLTILAVVAEKKSIATGLLLLFMFSVGHGVLAVVCGASTGYINELAGRKSFQTAETVIRFVLGGLILLLGIYMCWLGYAGD